MYTVQLSITLREFGILWKRARLLRGYKPPKLDNLFSYIRK